MNRVMVVELALPALIVPGHSVASALRASSCCGLALGVFGSDRGGRHTPIILGGVAVAWHAGVPSSPRSATVVDVARIWSPGMALLR